MGEAYPDERMTMSRQARALTLLAAVAVAGCGGRGGGGAEIEAPGDVVQGTRGRRCAFVMEAERAPLFDDLVRVGTRGSLSLWGRGLDVADTVELSIRYDAEGRLTWVQTLASTMDTQRVVELSRLVRAAVEEDGPQDWGVRIRFVAGAVDTVRPSVICDPVRADRGPVRTPPPMGTSRELAELYSALGRSFRVEVALDERGWVLDVRLPHSSGSRLLDQHALDAARASSYEPKLHDGIGVPSVLVVSVNYPRRL